MEPLAKQREDIYEWIMMCKEYNLIDEVNFKRGVDMKKKGYIEFGLLFIDSWSKLYEDMSIGRTDIRLFWELCKYGGINCNVIRYSKVEKDVEIIPKIGISQNHFSQSIKRLKNAGLIVGINGLYLINPYMLWIGKWTYRKKICNKNIWFLEEIFSNNKREWDNGDLKDNGEE